MKDGPRQPGSQRYRFVLEVEVTDTARLYEAAKARWIAVERELATGGDGDIERVEHTLGTPENINVRACVEWLLDPDDHSQPGIEVQWSGVEPDPFSSW